MFERHIGQETSKYKLNTYSSNVKEFEHWIQSYSETVKACGEYDKKTIPVEEEEGINSLIRGIYVREKIEKGEELNKKYLLFYAILRWPTIKW